MVRAPVICVTYEVCNARAIVTTSPTHHDIIYSIPNRVPKILIWAPHTAPWQLSLSPPICPKASSHHRELYFDYYMFPDYAYKVEYEAPGSTEVAEKVRKVFDEAGLKRLQDPGTHVNMGCALSGLRDENIAIVGPGFASCHSTAAMRRLISLGRDEVGKRFAPKVGQ